MFLFNQGGSARQERFGLSISIPYQVTQSERVQLFVHTLTGDRTQTTAFPLSISSNHLCFQKNSPCRIRTRAILTEVPAGTREDSVRLFVEEIISLVSSCRFAFSSLNVGRGSLQYIATAVCRRRSINKVRSANVSHILN